MRDQIRLFRRPISIIAGLLWPLLLAWQAPASAACLNDDARKVCVEVRATPSDSVQPSGMGGTATYVHYEVTLRNVSQQSTRFISLEIAFRPQVPIVSHTPPPKLSCVVGPTGSTLSCLADKLEAQQVLVMDLWSEAPPYAGAGTATELVNTAVAGWQGKTVTTTTTVAVATDAGQTYVPPDEEVTLTTAPRNNAPAEQTTPTDPLYAEVKIPSGSGNTMASLVVTANGPAFPECATGFYFDPLSDGGPFVCRETSLWVQAGIYGCFQDPALEFTLIWDDSIVPPAQLPPTESLSPNGTPPLAVFYKHESEPGTFVTRAYADACDAGNPQPPCVTEVQQFPAPSGDWTARLHKAAIQTDNCFGDGIVPDTPPIGNIR